MTGPIERILAKCIEQSIDPDTNEFQWEQFFRSWFREEGSAYYFLFKRHLGVTNTQYVELFSLLQLHSRNGATATSRQRLLFHTTENVKLTLVDAVNMLLESPSADRRNQSERFAKTYAKVFASTVAVDMFYCSCAVFFPPGISTNLHQVCADSGYIHSLGRSVFVRNIKKSRQKDFESSLDRYVASLSHADLPIPFVVYAHEDFSGHDRGSKEQIARGIEATKLYLEKMNMGSHRLSQIIQEMRSKYKGALAIPEPGPYDTTHVFEKPKTLWLISDRSISLTSPTNPGTERYYICYEQTAKSDSPFFLFDENKPAWKSHTTMPHSLTAALLNCTRPIPPQGAICDPFGGTGTTWLEAKRLGLDATVRCSDISDAAQLIVSDNLQFFLMTIEELNELRTALRDIGDAVRADRRGGSEASVSQASFDFLPQSQDLRGAGPYLYGVSLLNELRHDQPHEDQEFSLSTAFVSRLKSLPRLTRFVFYVVLRAELRYQGGFKRKSVTFEKAFCDSLDELIAQIEQYASLKAGLAKGVAPNGADSFVVAPSTYSKAIVPALILRSTDDFRSLLSSEVFASDARLLPERALDVVICDPPYGVNTTEDQAMLADLYSEFLDSALASLRDGGHLVLCVPEVSYTGRELPYCTRARVITNQVLTKAEALGRFAFVPARSIPSRIFLPPYYWESERALRRTILHFRVAAIPSRNAG